MEQKIKSLKTSSKIIAVITKIGYSVMIATVCICAAMLIFLGVTGGETTSIKIGNTNIAFYDELSSTPAEIALICSVLVVIGVVFLAIFLLAYRMFHEISLSGEPFSEKYAKTVRVIGILTAAMPFAAGLTEFIVTFFTKTKMPEMLSDIPGVVVGAIIFCLSYIIDYGCGIKKKLASDSDAKAAE